MAMVKSYNNSNHFGPNIRIYILINKAAQKNSKTNPILRMLVHDNSDFKQMGKEWIIQQVQVILGGGNNI